MPGAWIASGGVCLFLVGLVSLALSVIDRVVQRAKENGTITRACLLEAFGLFLCSVGLLALSLLMMARGWFWILEVPYQLVVGWALYLGHVLPRVNPDAGSVVSG